MTAFPFSMPSFILDSKFTVTALGPYVCGCKHLTVLCALRSVHRTRWQVARVPVTFASTTHPCYPGGRRWIIWNPFLICSSFLLNASCAVLEWRVQWGRECWHSRKKSWHPISGWAGLKPFWSGEARYSAQQNKNLWPFWGGLAVCAAHSASRLLSGYHGLLVSEG